MKVKLAKEFNSSKVKRMYNGTQGDMCYLGVTCFDIFSLACFNHGDFYFQFQLTVLFLTG